MDGPGSEVLQAAISVLFPVAVEAAAHLLTLFTCQLWAAGPLSVYVVEFPILKDILYEPTVR